MGLAGLLTEDLVALGTEPRAPSGQAETASALIGVLMSRAELERAAELTRRAGAWLVLDNTYGVVRWGRGSLL